MAMNEGWVDVTLAAGVGTGNWRHPDQCPGLQATNGSADTVELDFAPGDIRITRKTFPTDMGVGEVVVQIADQNSVRLQSTHSSDDSVFRVWARCRAKPAQYT